MAAIQNVFATRLLAELLGHEVDSGLLKEERPSNNPQTLHVKCAIVLGKEIANFSQKTLDEDIPPRLWKEISAYMCPWTLIKLGEEFLLKKGVNVDECWQAHYNRRWPWKYSRSALDLLDRHNLTHKQLYIDRHFMKFLEEYCRMKHLCLERVLSHDFMWCSVYEYDPKVTCYLPKHVQASMKTDTMATRVLALAPYVTSLTLNSTLSVFLECHLELVHLLLNSVVLLRVQCHPAITESNCCWNIIETFLKHGKLQEFSLTFSKRNDGFVGFFERLMKICAGIHDSESDTVLDSSFDCDISDCSKDAFDEHSEKIVNSLKCKSVYNFDSSIAKKLKLHSENIYFYNNNNDKNNNNDSGDNLNNCQRVFNNSNSLFDSIGAVDKNGHSVNCEDSISDVGKMQKVLDQKLRREKELNTPAVRNLGCCQKFRDKEGKNKDSLLTSSEENSLLTSMLWHQNLSSQNSSSSESHCHSNIDASPKSRKCLKSTFSRFDSKNHVITTHSKNMNCLNMSSNPFMMNCCNFKEHSISTDKLCKLCSYRMNNCFQSMTSCPHSIKFETKRKTSYSVLTALLSNSYDELAEVKKLRPADRYRYCKPLGKEFGFCSSTGKDSISPFSNSWDDNLSGSRSLCEEENISVVKCYQNADDLSQSDKASKTSDIGSSTESEVPNTESSASMSSSNISTETDTSSDQNGFDSFIGKIKDENGISNKSCFKSPPTPKEKKRMCPSEDVKSRTNSAVDSFSPLTPQQLESRRMSFDIYADLDEGISEEETPNSKTDSSLSDSQWLSPANCQHSSPVSTPGSTKSDNSLWDLCLGLSKKTHSLSSKGLKSLRLIGEPNPHIGDILRDVLPMWPSLQKLYLNVSGLNNPELLDIISDLVNKKQLKDLSIIGCETEDGVFRRLLNCLLKSYRDDGKKEGLNLLNIQSLADPSITCSAILPQAEPLYGVKTLILRDNTFDVFGVTGLLRIITYDNALVKLNLKCCFLHAWMGQLLAAIASKGQMEELYLGSNQIEGTHPELELINVIDSCKNLRKLDLRSCSLRSQVVLSDSFISALRNHKSLEFLCLKANRLGVTVLSLIDKLHDRKESFSLKVLNISGNPFNVERYGVDTILKTYRCQPRVPWLRELKMKSCFQISNREKEKDIHNYIGKWISGYAKHVGFNIEVSSCGLRFVEYADANTVVYM
ncbi:uncharacterized protein LOC115215002 isoform X2 [Octopus sinensis]|nr:uncharacterized protein LOC115215002 isoform X2 [Octopus sinensis]